MSTTMTSQRPVTVRAVPQANRVLAAVLVALALGMASASVLGPLVLGWMRYRTSSTTLNQLEGADLAVLVFVVPLTLVAALLAFRGHQAAPVLATGIGAFALYTYAQVVIGQEYLRLPGNVERFFPLLLAVFVLAEAAVVLGVRATPSDLPAPSPRVQRVASVVLFLVALFLVFGQHLRPMLTAWQDPSSLTEYASSPTPFWMVKLMDLGIIVPAAVAAGLGLWRGAGWALRIAYMIFTAYTCLGVSVAAMAMLMSLRSDPDASVGLMLGFGTFAVVFAAITVLLYCPLVTVAHTPPDELSV